MIYLQIFSSEYIYCVKSVHYGIIFGPYFPVFGLNTGEYGPEITPYLDTFHAMFRLPMQSFLVTTEAFFLCMSHLNNILLVSRAFNFRKGC